MLAKAVLLHSDNPVQGAQRRVNDDTPHAGSPAAADVVLAHIIVAEDRADAPNPREPIAAENMTTLMTQLTDRLPPVQEYLRPIDDDELVVTQDEVSVRGVPAGSHRTRTVTYSGLGNADFPLVSTDPSDPSAERFRAFIENDQTNNDGRLENLIYARNPATGRTPSYVLLPANIRTMAITLDNPVPIDREHAGLPRKFDPTDPNRARILEGTAEEWALYNNSDMLWGNTTTAKRAGDASPDEQNDPTRGGDNGYRQPITQYEQHYISHPMSRGQGQQIFNANHDFQIVTRAIDHPFHIHQNPFWVLRIEVPDATGELHNILDEPRWQDVIWIPATGGAWCSGRASPTTSARTFTTATSFCTRTTA